MASKLVGLEFEVYGRVQGVFFRKFTQERGRKLDLKGWCRNTDRGTVIGYIEGDKEKIEEMSNCLDFGSDLRYSNARAEISNRFCSSKHYKVGDSTFTYEEFIFIYIMYCGEEEGKIKK